MTAVIERIGRDRPVLSVEFFPPRDDAGDWHCGARCGSWSRRTPRPCP